MTVTELDLAVIGGGAAGYFAALRAAALNPALKIAIFESGRRTLEKVRISGGGRCNVTHQCFEPKLLKENYPRGSKELLSAFHKFQPQDTVAWFAERGVELKTEADGRMFPVTDSSETVISCLERERQALGIVLHTQCRVESVQKDEEGSYLLKTTGALEGEFGAAAVLLATGGHKSGYQFAGELGHSITPLAPSLFTFNVSDKQLCALSGVSVPRVNLSLEINGVKHVVVQKPLLITHWGLSGPAVLKLSSLAALELFDAGYRGDLLIDWTAGAKQDQCRSYLRELRSKQPFKSISKSPLYSIPSRLWELLVRRTLAQDSEQVWSRMSNLVLESLVNMLTRHAIAIDGKGQFKEEFVTSGGVDLREVDFRSMQSKLSANLYISGELLNIDGVTGGFNFQSAWTTGWIAGTAVAESAAR